MLAQYNPATLLLSSLILAASTVMADSDTPAACGTEYELLISASTTTCDKEHIIQREFNMNAWAELCGEECASHPTCTHFSRSEMGTCVSYSGCTETREAQQVWDTYVILNPCTPPPAEVAEEIQAPASVQVALGLLQELEGVLEEIGENLSETTTTTTTTET